MEPFVIGDFCFANGKTFPWWPAVIVNTMEKSTKKGRRLLFSVEFYGTDESALVPPSELRHLTPENIAKSVTKAALRRKYFKNGYREMLKLSGYEDTNDNRAEKEARQESNSLEEESRTHKAERCDRESFFASLGLKLIAPSGNNMTPVQEASIGYWILWMSLNL